MDGEYAGEVVPLPPLGPANASVLIGRSSSCDVTLGRDDQISRRHVQIEWRDGGLYVRDLGSTYGTRVNASAVDGKAHVALRPGDVLGMGASTFQLQAITPPAHC